MFWTLDIKGTYRHFFGVNNEKKNNKWKKVKVLNRCRRDASGEHIVVEVRGGGRRRRRRRRGSGLSWWGMFVCIFLFGPRWEATTEARGPGREEVDPGPDRWSGGTLRCGSPLVYLWKKEGVTNAPVRVSLLPHDSLVLSHTLYESLPPVRRSARRERTTRLIS